MIRFFFFFFFCLCLLPDMFLGAIYIPPLDSPFFSNSSFATLQEQVLNSPNSKLLIMGDLNARIGSLNYLQTLGKNLKYTNNPDIIVNNHGKIIIEMSKTVSIVPVWHVKREWRLDLPSRIAVEVTVRLGLMFNRCIAPY